MFRNLLWGALALWALAYGASLWALFWTEPNGDGFTRGLNRVAGFMGWQLLAAFLAVVAWAAGRRAEVTTPIRWLSRVPTFLAAALGVFIAGVIVMANVSKPPPDPGPARPVTKPASE